VALAALAARPL
jgi:hypothetical protein